MTSSQPTVEQIYTRLQSDRAESGQAAGQCLECGSFRSDGRPPTLHQDGCSHADDGKPPRSTPVTVS